MTNTAGGGSQGPYLNQDKKEFKLFALRDRFRVCAEFDAIERDILWRMSFFFPKNHFESNSTLVDVFSLWQIRAIADARRRLRRRGMIEKVGVKQRGTIEYRITQKCLKLVMNKAEIDNMREASFIQRLIMSCEST